NGHRLAFYVRGKAFTRDREFGRKTMPPDRAGLRCRIALRSIVRGKPDMPQTLTFDSPSTIHEHGDLRVREHFDRLCQGFNNNFPMTWPLSSSAWARPASASGRRSWISGRVRPAGLPAQATKLLAGIAFLPGLAENAGREDVELQRPFARHLDR